MHARDFDNCTVKEIIVAGATNGHVRISCGISPRPTCATAGDYFGFDKSTEEGKQYLSMVLTAYATDALVSGNVHDTLCPASQGNVGLLTHLRMKR